MNMKTVVKALMAVSLITVSVPMQNVRAQEPKEVSVKLINYLGNKKSIPIRTTGEYYLAGDKNFKLMPNYNYSIEKTEDNNIEIKMNGNALIKLKSGFTLVPLTYGTVNTISVDGIKYLGNMKFIVENGNIRPINTLSLEDYLKGVVPYEMSDSWALEALKAQAVSARTYAMRQIQNGNVINDTISYQVYKGYSEGNSNSIRAVNETKGQVVQYSGKLAETYYSATNGGIISSATNSWGSNYLNYPYLTKKEDPYSVRAGQHLNWNYSLNKIQIDVSGLDLTNPSVWWDTVSEKDTTIIPTLKTKMGLPSGSKIVEIKDLKFTTGNYAANQILNGTIVVQYMEKSVMENGSIKLSEKTVTTRHDQMRSYFGNQGSYQNLRSPNVASVTLKDGKYTVIGNGFGHGIGMSQWGAYQMAKEGKKYDEIIKFYYEGTTLETVDTNFTGEIPAAPADIISKNPANETNPENETKTYTVKSGDTRWSIGQMFGITPDEISEWNQLTSGVLYTGQVLIVSKPMNSDPKPEPNPPVEESNPPVEEPKIQMFYASNGGAKAYKETSQTSDFHKTYPTGYTLKLYDYNSSWYYGYVNNQNGELTKAYFYKDEVQQTIPAITLYASNSGAKAYKTISKAEGFHKTYPTGYTLKLYYYNSNWYYGYVNNQNGELTKAYFYKDEVQQTVPAIMLYASNSGAKAYITTNKKDGTHKTYPAGYTLKLYYYNSSFYYGYVNNQNGVLTKAFFSKDEVQVKIPAIIMKAAKGGSKAYITTNRTGIYYKKYPSGYTLKLYYYNSNWYYGYVNDQNGMLTKAFFSKDEVN